MTSDGKGGHVGLSVAGQSLCSIKGPPLRPNLPSPNDAAHSRGQGWPAWATAGGGAKRLDGGEYGVMLGVLGTAEISGVFRRRRVCGEERNYFGKNQKNKNLSSME